MLRVLAVGAHPDDIEFGCGGTLSSFRDRGFAIRAVILTRGEAGANGHDRVRESARALSCLGVSDLATYDFPDAQLSTRFDELVRVLEQHLEEWQPDIVFTMSSKDHHQDHRVTFDATMAAARAQPTILAYETPNSPPDFCPAAFFDISSYLPAKLEAMRRHNSQNHKWYLGEDHMVHRAYLRGLQARMNSAPRALAAEAFEVFRLRLSDVV